MELSPGKQKLLFVVIVAALAVVGYVLVVPALHRGASGPAKPAPASSAPTVTPSTATPVVAQAPAGAVNIYDWLPFTQQDLADAAAVATKFGVDYDTFTYNETAAGYLAKMNGLITADLAASLQNAYTAPGVASLRTGQKQSATASASIVSLRAFGPSSLTFVVSIGQRLVSSRGTSNGSQQYAMTLTGSAGSWQVNDIEYARSGNT